MARPLRIEMEEGFYHVKEETEETGTSHLPDDPCFLCLLLLIATGLLAFKRV